MRRSTERLQKLGIFRFVAKQLDGRRDKVHEYLRSQNRHKRCQICGDQPLSNGTTFCFVKLVLDHDHQTGFVRDYLCRNCNAGLGAFKDNPEVLEKAAAYLRRHKEHHNLAQIA